MDGEEETDYEASFMSLRLVNNEIPFKYIPESDLSLNSRPDDVVCEHEKIGGICIGNLYRELIIGF